MKCVPSPFSEFFADEQESLFGNLTFKQSKFFKMGKGYQDVSAQKRWGKKPLFSSISKRMFEISGKISSWNQWKGRSQIEYNLDKQNRQPNFNTFLLHWNFLIGKVDIRKTRTQSNFRGKGKEINRIISSYKKTLKIVNTCEIMLKETFILMGFWIFQ